MLGIFLSMAIAIEELDVKMEVKQQWLCDNMKRECTFCEAREQWQHGKPIYAKGDGWGPLEFPKGGNMQGAVCERKFD